MAVIEVQIEQITDWATFHEVFAQALHFPDYYGKNGDAFIDCLRDIAHYDTNPDLRLAEGETLTMYLGDHIQEFRRRCSEQLEALQDWVAFVNTDDVDEGVPPRILIAFR